MILPALDAPAFFVYPLFVATDSAQPFPTQRTLAPFVHFFHSHSWVAVDKSESISSNASVLPRIAEAPTTRSATMNARMAIVILFAYLVKKMQRSLECLLNARAKNGYGRDDDNDDDSLGLFTKL